MIGIDDALFIIGALCILDDEARRQAEEEEEDY